MTLHTGLPVLLLAGAQPALRARLIERLVAGAPSQPAWGLILASRLAAPPQGVSEAAVARLGGCLCCMGAAPLLSAVRQLRRAQSRLAGLIIELDARAQLCRMIDCLRSQSVISAGLEFRSVLAVVGGSAPPHPKEWLNDECAAQLIATADRVWFDRPEPLAAVAQSLREGLWSESVLVVSETPPPWMLQDVIAESPGRAGANALPEQPAWMPITTGDQGQLWRWRAPPSVAFDRRRLQAVLAEFAVRVSMHSARGAFRTEREWYQWNPEADWAPSFWRRDSRLDVWMASDSPGQAWCEALEACAA